MGRIVKSKGHRLPSELLSAREEAAQRLAGIGALEAEARRRGYDEGFREGHEAGLAAITERFAAARAELEAQRNAAKDLALGLARKMAERIVGRAVASDPDVLAEIVAQALAASRVSSGRLAVRLHPTALAALETKRAALVERAGDELDLRFVSDESVGPAGCIVETPIGRLDARLESQLDALERALAARAR